MSTAAERDFSFRNGRASLASFMVSGATPNLSFWVMLTTETPQKGKKAWQGKTELPLCGRKCLATAEARLNSARDREVGTQDWSVTPRFWETW